MERRTRQDALELRQAGDRIAGLAAVHYDGTPATEFRIGDYVERILPGAFDNALDGNVRALFNHDHSLLLGTTQAGSLEIRHTDQGLQYEILPGDTSVARDVREFIRRGEVTGSSFGFRIAQSGDKWTLKDGKRIRTISKIEMVGDVGPVTEPAYPGTSAMLRSLSSAYKESRSLVIFERATQCLKEQPRCRRTGNRGRG